MDNWERTKALNPSKEKGKNAYDLDRLISISSDPLSFFLFTFLWVVADMGNNKSLRWV